MARQSSAQAGDGVGTRRAVTDRPRVRRRRRRSSPRDGGSDDAGKQGHLLRVGIIELIILNKRVAPDLAICRWYTVATSPTDRSGFDRQREEAVEGRGYKRWMSVIDVTILSAPSI
jgi:hypothetical protein